MQSLRDILRSDLRRSLGALKPLDRLSAAWPVAAGHAIAERSAIVRIEQAESGIRAIAAVRDRAWLPELRAHTPRLVADLASVSGIAVADILFLEAEPGEHPRPARKDHDEPFHSPYRRRLGRRQS